MSPIEQGDICAIENLKDPVLIVSKNFFNRTEAVIACPIVAHAPADPLHLPVRAGSCSGYVLCEHVRFLDMKVRGYTRIASLPTGDLLNILDAIQGIFDYY